MLVLGLLGFAGVKGGKPQIRPDATHVAMVRAKQAVWLEKHPILLRISRSQFEGIPGDMLTSTCWHVMKAMTTHHPANAGRAMDGSGTTTVTAKRG